MEINKYSLKDIKDWMISDDSKVELPAMQRGFVWKTSQIENLWDSIFREFPIGSIMLTSSGDKLMLIDGQQRTTSIALGFYNPWTTSIQSFGNAKNLPVVWIDVQPKYIPDNSEFVFRVVTRSHPWGYQLMNNNKVLSIPDRRTASEDLEKFFSVDMYTKLASKQRLPYDATLPVPLCFLFEAITSEHNYEDWKRCVIDMCQSIPADYRTKHMSSETTYFKALHDCNMESIYQRIQSIYSNYYLPAICVSNDLILRNNDKSSVNPTLFVRLNSGGTKLEGEELIYSIYKAVCPSTKTMVEEISNTIVSPAKIISLTSRLILSKLRNNFYKSISLTQFQREIEKDDFRTALEDFIGDNTSSSLSTLFYRALKILKYDGTFPDVIVKKFIKDRPDGFLLLLNWLFNNDEEPDTLLTKKICARLYLNYWFGDLDEVVRRTWQESSRYDYWDEPYNNRDYFAQRPLIKPESLETFFLKRVEKADENLSISPADEDIWAQWSASFPKLETMSEEDNHNAIKAAWDNFIWRLLGNKYLVLLAQNNYINKTFADFNQIEDLQDTETPWDWDHIYPQSWVYRRWYIDDRTKKWEWRIGNFRAMSLTDNRSENNNLSPAERFIEPNEDYFIKDNDLQYWSKLDHSFNDGDTEFVLIHAKAIIIRTVNIYRNIYDLFSAFYK